MKRVAMLVVVLVCAVCACGPDFSSVSCADGECEQGIGGAGGADGSPERGACCAHWGSGQTMCLCRLEHPVADCTQAWWNAEYPDDSPTLAGSSCPNVVVADPNVWCCRKSPLDPHGAPENRNYCSCRAESSELCANELATVDYSERVDRCP